jgi:YYY domain-containing protein
MDQLLDGRTSPLNIRRAAPDCPPEGCRYPYGSLPVYVNRATAWVLDTVLPATDERPKGYFLKSSEGATLLGRHLSGIFDLVTVFLVFLIGRRLYSRSTGLIAAALVGFAVTHIQIAHFFASDSFLVAFMMGALYFSVVLMQRPAWWAAMGLGTFLGFAIASKVSIAPFALLVVAAVVLRAIYRKRTRKLGAELGDPLGVKPASERERELSSGGHIARGLRYVAIAILFTLLAFAATEPYVLTSFNYSRLASLNVTGFLESSQWWQVLQEERRTQSGQSDLPFTRQYIGTVPLLYHLQNMVFWGLSPIPGIVTVVGFAVGLWMALRRRPAEVLLMAGAVPYFATILTLEAKWMRYMLPLVPIFCLLGAALLVRGIAWERKRRQNSAYAAAPQRRPIMSRIGGNAFAIITAMSIAGAFLWAVAFMNIYSQEHSRIQASRWIRVNIPSGVMLSEEIWDDRLPLDVKGAPPRQYKGHVQFNLYDDQPPEQEFNYIKGLLGQADYIILASNRLYGSIPRLPWRYPVQTRFYELLFEGKLGFVKVHTQHEAPELLGIRFDDQLADESFTVYDHPRVDVFRKVNVPTDDQLKSYFSPALNRPLGEYRAERHGKVSDDKSLTYKEYGPAIPYNKPVSALPDTGDYAWNPLAQDETQWIAVLLWLLVAYVLGLLALPITFVVCRNLSDRGYPLAKVVGLLLVSWGIWMASSAHLIPFTAWGVLLMALLMAGLSYVCWRLGAGEQIKEFVRTKARLIVFYEAVFLLAFAAFLVIRILNPDQWHPWNGGEKPMETGFLNSILRSAWMPPLDPFFAGGVINYYYYGHFVVACLIKLVGVDPAIAFNLAIPLLYALTMGGAVSLVYNLVAWSQRRRGSTHSVSRAGLAFGVLSGVLMLVIGNMHGFFQWIRLSSPPAWDTIYNALGSMGVNVDALRGITDRGTFDFWGPRSIIPFTINEWPFWTFLFADLHPHLINMPFTLLAAVLSLNLVFSGRLRRAYVAPDGGRGSWAEQIRWTVGATLEWLWGRGWTGALRFALMALSLGVLAAINSWDFPTYMALAGVAALVALILADRDSATESATSERSYANVQESARRNVGQRLAFYIAGIASVGVLSALALLAYLPFFLNFKAFYTEILPITDGNLYMRRTTLPEFLVMWAIFVFIALSYLVVRLWRFPWSAVFGEIRGAVPSRPRAVSGTMSPQQAFSIEPAFPRRQEFVTAMAGPQSSTLVVPTASMHFHTEQFGGTSSTQDTSGSPEATLEQAPPVEQLVADAERDQLASPVAQEAHAGDGASATTSPNGANGAETLDTLEATEPVRSDLHAQDTQPNLMLADTPTEYRPASWVVDAHSQAQAQVEPAPRPASPGIIPVWAGVAMLAATATLTALQLTTGQHLLALLIALIGGITATTLASTRSPGVLFASVLLVGALTVAMGVELVYLADHLRGGEMFRMNTVFKFYIQVWVLIAAGCAAAVYYILYGSNDRPASSQGFVLSHSPSSNVANQPITKSEAVADSNVSSAPVETTEASSYPESTQGNGSQQPRHDNWMVWSSEVPDSPMLGDDDAGDGSIAATATATATEPTERVVPAATPEVAANPATSVATPQVSIEARANAGIKWNLPKIAWTGLLALFIAACLTYPLLGVPARVADRFPGKQPPLGTLNGMKYMEVGTFTTDAAPFPIVLKYDYNAIEWMKRNISGHKVIAEIPLGYYREHGMRAAANTGLSMIVGALHQEEQRAGVYDRLVGDRRRDMNELFSTTDIQQALTLISKYDIDYIYMGQLEQARSGAGASKFEQMAEDEVGILKPVFSEKDEETGRGTTVYQVVKDARTIVGVPVEGSGLPGISITPLPTPTATPFPTPPVDDPQLKALIDDVAADPNNREKRFKLVEWYNQRGYFVDAARELSTLIQQDPQNVALRHQLGDAYQAAGQPDRALKAWEEARDVDPNNPPGHNKVGIAYFERGRYDDAVRAFEEAIRIDPAFIEAWYHLGESFEAKGDVGNARNAYQNAIDKSAEPNSWSDSARDRLNRLK